MTTASKRRSESAFGRVFVILCLLILATLGSGWLLTGRLVRLHEAAILSYNSALRGAGPTWQQISCVKAWDQSPARAADRATCGTASAAGTAH